MIKRHQSMIIVFYTEEAMKSFCQIYNFKHLLDKHTCCKNPNNPSCLDLIITNKPRKSCTFETGLSNFHKITLTVLKSSLQTETKSTKLPQLQILQQYSF